MNKPTFAFAAVVIGFWIAVYVPATLAQQALTVGDLLNMGAKKVTKQEMQQLYSGATVSGTQIGRSEVIFQNKHRPDGTVTGISWRNGVLSSTTTTGNWIINDGGQLCYDLQGGAIRGCQYFFTFGNRFFAARSDDRAELVYERQFSR
jgi:hypothetical protein